MRAAIVVVLLACLTGCSPASGSPARTLPTQSQTTAAVPSSEPTSSPEPSATRETATKPIYAKVKSAKLAPCDLEPTDITAWATNGAHEGKAVIARQNVDGAERACWWELPAAAASSIDMEGWIAISFNAYSKEPRMGASGKFFTPSSPKKLVNGWYDDFARWLKQPGLSEKQELSRQDIELGAVSFGHTLVVAQRDDLWFYMDFHCDESSTAPTCDQAAVNFARRLSEALG